MLGFLAYAEEELPAPNPVSFKVWREQQVIEAQNRLARFTNQLVLVKAGKAQADKNTLEKEIVRSQNALEVATGLTPTDYYVGYLHQYQEKPDVLLKAASQLSKEEIVELMQGFFKANAQNLTNPSQRGAYPRPTKRLEAHADSASLLHGNTH